MHSDGGGCLSNTAHYLRHVWSQHRSVPMPEVRFYLMKYKFIAIKPVYDIISRNKGEYNWSMIWLGAEPWEKLKHAKEKESNYPWSEIQGIIGQRLQGKTALFAVCLVISAHLKTIALGL